MERGGAHYTRMVLAQHAYGCIRWPTTRMVLAQYAYGGLLRTAPRVLLGYVSTGHHMWLCQYRTSHVLAQYAYRASAVRVSR
eukprot:367870-Rhodomonas_salina.1